MSKKTLHAFSTGEIAPDLTSSTELEKWAYGLSECSNMIVDALGGVKNRPGLQYRADCYDTTKLTRLIPFQFNVEQAYELEFSDLKMRIIKDGAIVVLDLVDAAYKWTLSGSGTGEYHLELAAGGDPGILETAYVLEDNVKMVAGTVGSLAASEWDHGDNDTLGYSTIYVRIADSTDPDTKAQGYIQIPVEVVTPYSISEIQALNYTQSADTIYMYHGSYNTRKITRTSATSWTITEMPDMDGPYKPRVDGDEDVKITISFVSGTAWQFTADAPIFGDVEVGEPIRLGFPIPGATDSLNWTWYVVAILTSDTVITASLQDETRPIYQQVVNPFFKDGLDSWQDISIGTLGEVSYDSATQRAILTDFADGQPTVMEQGILTFSQEKQRIFINVAALTGATPQVFVKVGTTSGLGDIFTSAAITVTGTYIYTFLPTQELVYINFTTTGSTNGDIIEISAVEVFPIGNLPAGTSEYTTTDWRLAAWNSTHGYPENGIIHEQRLFSVGNEVEPQTIWASQLGNFESHEFNTPSVSTDAFSFLPNPDLNGVNWLLLQNGLKVGTAGGIWKVYAASGGALTPTDVNIQIDNAVGSLDLPPITIGNSIIMTPRGYEAVSELTSSFETSGYVPRDISALAAHLFEDRRIISWTYARNPDSVIWCVLDNGTLLGMTYLKEYGVWAWHKHTTPLGEGFKDVSSIPNSFDDNIDDVYFIINRAELGDTPNYYIEQLNKRITPQTAAYGLSASGTGYDYKFLDSALTLDNPKTITGATKANPVVITSTAHGFSNGDTVRIQNVVGMTELNNVVYTVANQAANTFELSGIDGTAYTAYLEGGEAREMVTVISGLGHLEGETVTALADGRVEEGLVVTSGAVTLAIAASFGHIGLPYTSQGETVDIETTFNTGSTQGGLKSLTKVDAYFKDTRGAEFAAGSLPTVWWPAPFDSEAFGETPPPLFNGVKEVVVTGTPKKTETVKFRQTKPLPFHLKRLIVDVKYGG